MRRWESHQVARRLNGSAPGCQRTRLPRAAPLPPSKVVAQRELWKVQLGAEGYQGRHWGPAFAKDRRLRARFQVVLGAGAGRQSRNLHPGPQRSAPLGSAGRGLHHRSRKDTAASPSPLVSSHPSTGAQGAGRGGMGAAPAPG